MKSFFKAFLPLFVVAALFGGCASKESDALVAEVGGSKVTLKEYEDFYAKNSGGYDSAQASTMDERKHFLDLLTEYRLKLNDAYAQGLQNDTELSSELRDYRASLASSYILDKEINEPGTKQIYDRRKEEIDASQILVQTRAAHPAAESLAAYQKACQIDSIAMTGVDFDSLARAMSEDPSAKQNGGRIYYFTGGNMLPQFEDAAYGLKKGQVGPKPIYTQIGFVVLKVNDRVPHRSMKIRHIMIRFSPPADTDSVAAYSKIHAMQDSLKKGADFKRLAFKFSEDGGSAKDSGNLGWFERRRWVQVFDEAALKLNPGENSPIIRTQFGLHIIHCDSTKLLPPYDSIKDDLKKVYQQFRYTEDYNKHVSDLKARYHYKFDEANFSDLTLTFDSTKMIEDSSWAMNIPRELRGRPLITINNHGYTIDTIVSILTTRPEFKETSLITREIRPKFDLIGEYLLLDEEAVGLEGRSPEFAQLMADYRDGIVLFKAQQLAVWNKITITDSALHAFYDAHRDSFMTAKKVDYSEIHVDSDTLALVLYDSISRGANFDTFADRYNDDPDLRAVHGERGPQDVDSDDVAMLADSLHVGEISEPIQNDGGGYSIIRVNSKVKPRQKTFDEAGAEVSNKLQEDESRRLEREWVDRLRLKYPVVEHPEVLSKAFTGPRPDDE